MLYTKALQQSLVFDPAFVGLEMLVLHLNTDTFGLTKKYINLSVKIVFLCVDSMTHCRILLLYNSFPLIWPHGVGGGELRETEGEAKNESQREHLNC